MVLGSTEPKPTLAKAEPFLAHVKQSGVSQDGPAPERAEPAPEVSVVRWRIAGGRAKGTPKLMQIACVAVGPGLDKGGIIVRQSESLKSAELGRALALREQVSGSCVVGNPGGFVEVRMVPPRAPVSPALPPMAVFVREAPNLRVKLVSLLPLQSCQRPGSKVRVADTNSP